MNLISLISHIECHSSRHRDRRKDSVDDRSLSSHGSDGKVIYFILCFACLKEKSFSLCHCVGNSRRNNEKTSCNEINTLGINYRQELKGRIRLRVVRKQAEMLWAETSDAVFRYLSWASLLFWLLFYFYICCSNHFSLLFLKLYRTWCAFKCLEDIPFCRVSFRSPAAEVNVFAWVCMCVHVFVHLLFVYQDSESICCMIIFGVNPLLHGCHSKLTFKTERLT